MGSEIQSPQKQENAFNSIILNILLPVVVLTQGDRVSDNPAIVLSVALAFPVVYFFYDLNRRKKVNFISILGFISILLTGGVGLLQLPRFWFIVKETAIPAIIGLVVVGSLLTKKPLVKLFVFSPQMFDVEKIESALTEKNNNQAMDKLLRQSTLLLAVSFFFSATLNFILASHFVKTEPSLNQAQFNTEVGAMTGWSYLVIALPSMVFMVAIFFLLTKGIKRLTGMEFEESLAPQLREKA